ncbi:MAG: NAD(P)-binding protein, partial [Rhodothermaceae bacterium]|nr:NAD(P)-binding protein [Rhodothermaceae bacterium]
EADVAALCAACAIDHGIGPVAETPGGARAGYERWETFKQHGLRGYHRLRNNAAAPPPEGVSRLSPYLHHGHVSPFRIAREAAADGSDGAEKYLDELLVWREMAYNFCFYTDELETLEALPDWARETLEAHASDERDALYSWDQLARGETGDALWDAAQHSLLRHGELHNNVRMTWGKALLRWTPTPSDALAMLIDLNHRYALDGSDPNSYGGLLWALGLFDRPSGTEVPIYGTVRTRSTADHAERLDMDRYAGRVTRPAHPDAPSVAIVGAGLSGLVAARTLSDQGLAVQVFDKGRGPGGRMSTRRTDNFSFDHGAQYFTVRDDRFRRYISAWLDEGLVQPWDGAIGVAKEGTIERKDSPTTRYVGVPRMSSLARHLATSLPVRYETRVERVARDGRHWRLQDTEGTDLGTYDAVLITAPPPQSAPLLADAPALAEQVRSVTMLPCWAVMVTFAEPLPLAFDGLFVHDAPLSWAARNSSKPERPDGESWVLHGAPGWSADRLEADPETVGTRLLAAFFEATGLDPVEAPFVQAHRWRYSMADEPLSVGCLWDPEQRIGACGDWCHGSRVEGAFLSGMAAAGRVLGMPVATG